VTRYDFDRSDRVWDGVRFIARLVAVAGLLAILAGVCQGCSLTPPEKAQATLTAGAETLDAFSDEAAERLTEHAEDLLREVSTMLEFREGMAGYDALVVAARSLKSALLTAQAAVNVWIATGDDAGWRSVAGCLATQVGVLFDAAQAVDMQDRLSSLRTVVQLAEAYTDGLCPEGAR
jgi:hypothetical protein